MISNLSHFLLCSRLSFVYNQIDCFTNDSWAVKRIRNQRRVFVLPVTRVRTAVFIKPSKMFAWLDVKAPLGSAATSPAFSLSLSFLFCPLLSLFAHFHYVPHAYESFMTFCQHSVKSTLSSHIVKLNLRTVEGNLLDNISILSIYLNGKFCMSLVYDFISLLIRVRLGLRSDYMQKHACKLDISSIRRTLHRLLSSCKRYFTSLQNAL